MRQILICLLLTFVSIKLFAQTITIKGYVKDTSGKAVSYVIVSFKQDTISQPLVYAITNDEGYFAISIKQEKLPGIIEINSINFNQKILKIGSDDTISNSPIVIHLQHRTTPLPDVIVKSEIPIYVRGDTTTFNVKAFKTGYEKNIGNLLSNMPGFEVLNNGKIKFNGKIIDKILIEGDDLMGRDYGELTNKLSPNGLKEIDVIDNYTDNENIISNFDNFSNRQVINLKYDSGYINKNFGNAELSGGLINRYESSVQTVSVFKNFKNFLNLNINNTGTLSKKTFQSQDERNDENDLLSFNNHFANGFKSLVNMPNDVAAKTNPLYENTTRSLLATSFFRPLKHFVVRNTLAISTDTFAQKLNSNIEFLLPPLILHTYNNQYINQHINGLKDQLSINYIRPNNQLVIIGRLMMNHYTLINTGNQFGSSYNENYNFKYNNIYVKSVYIHKFSNNAAVFGSFQFSSSQLPGNLQLWPANYFKHFPQSVNWWFMQQQESQRGNHSVASISYIKKVYNHKLSFQLLNETSSSSLFNSINITDSALYIHPFSNDSINHFHIHYNYFVGKIEDHWWYRKDINVVYGLKYYYIANRPTFSANCFKQNILTPYFSVVLKLSTHQNLSFTYNNEPVYPDINKVGTGYQFTDFNTITKGQDSMYISNAKSLNLNYSWLDFFDKKQLFLVGVLYRKQPQNFITFSNPGLTDNLIYNAVTDKYLQLYSVFIKLEKYYHNYQIKIAPQLSFSQIQLYTGIGSDLYQVKNISTRVGVATSIKFNKALIADCNFFQTFNRSGSAYNSINVFASYISSLDMGLSWKYKSVFSVNGKFSGNYNSSPNQPSRFSYMDELALMMNVKHNLTIGLNARNIFFTKYFSGNYVTATYSSFTQYTNFPRVVLLTVTYTW
ncbi:hypothetical protein [Hydrotalea sp.]|uniref:carboxypeptidase-like regulatory domain-containing protein n=1 Tax=Hydrotalea sp. TaxID=2881279 RepID=UPI002625756E|nr:hypothetical protein [Hydrotalea sp.]